MEVFSGSIARAAVATGVAIAGGALGAFAGGSAAPANRLDFRSIPLVAVAGGALLAVAALGVLPEAAQRVGIVGAIVAAAIGYAFFFLVGKYLYPVCPACSSAHDHHASIGAQSAANVTVLLAITVTAHAFVDGLAVSDESRSRLTVALLLAIGLHKLPEGIALAALLRGAGRSPAIAFALSALIETATLLGGIVGGTFVAHVSPSWCGTFFAHLAGGFIYLVVNGLWSGTSRTASGLWWRLAYSALGFAVIALLMALLPH